MSENTSPSKDEEIDLGQLFTLIGIQIWFTYFWVYHELSWAGFLPLVIIYLIFQIQLPMSFPLGTTLALIYRKA